MGLRSRLFTWFFRRVFRLLCRLDLRGLDALPFHGPGLIVTNHTSDIEGPLLYVLLRPRATTALGKSELWKFFATRMLMEAWKVIPLHRGRLDRRALDRAQGILDRGDFLCLAPEGRRSPDGTLQRGQPGAVWFALENAVPIYPLAVWGTRELFHELLHLRRPVLHVRTGEPFRVGPGLDRQQAADALMEKIAHLLPGELRGYYR